MKTNITLSAIVSQICMILLALLGFGCEKDGFPDDDEPPMLMYGTPYGVWEVKGTVTDEDDEPVANATVKITYPNVYSSVSTRKIVTTDENGYYFTGGAEGTEQALKIVCLPSNTELEADSTVIDVKFTREPVDKEQGGWYIGRAKHTVNFKLNEKKPANEN